MKKVLVLSSFPAPYRVAVFKGLSNYYNLDVFFGDDKDQNRNKEYFEKKILLIIMSYRFLVIIKYLKSVDFVLAYDWAQRYALKVEFKCILKGVPYIINCDGAFIEEGKGLASSVKSIIKRFFIQKARLCLSSGKYASRYFEYYGASKENIKEHNFSSLFKKDLLKFPISQNEKILLRQNLKLNKSKMVLAVGQFIKRKGFDIMLSAWKDFDDEFQLVIIGGGEEKNKYIELINNNYLNNVFLIDFLSKEKIKEYYLAADVFVLPTREDIWGLVVIEALAVGVPVISTNKCIAALELIKNGY